MAGPSSPTREGTLLDGRYRLLEPIGAGGMASVWLGEDERLGRPTAVKLLAEGLVADSAFSARFRREAQIAAGLTHPNLVGIYDFDPDADRPYLVMEYVPGPNLAERLSAGDPIDPERLAQDLLSALDAIHRAGVVHRDVKPENVLLATSGRAMLTDFGIARPEDATSITQTGQVPGTARYMAPELTRGEPASPASDLYSCGVVLEECIRGRDHGLALHQLVGSLTEPDRAMRASSASAALDELLGPRVAAPPVLPAEPRPDPGSGEDPTVAVEAPARRARLGVLAALLVVALVTAGLIALTGNDPAPVGPGKKAPAGSGGESESSGGQAGREERSRPEAAGAVPAPSSDPDPARGAVLNDEGYSLIQAGRAEEAAGVLREAVAAFPAGTDDLNYAYALFNLGRALRLAGHPEEAIPVLRRRLEIPNQTETVRAELEAALAASR